MKKIYIYLSVTLFFIISACSNISDIWKECNWVNDTNGIKLWTPINEDATTYTWKGQSWNSYAHGKGTITIYDANNNIIKQDTATAYYGAMSKWHIKDVPNGKYVGEVYEKTMDGFGILVKKDSIFVGQFKNSIPNGRLDWYVNNRLCYTGNWENGSFNGEGTLYKEDGTETTGIWKNGAIYEKMVDITTEVGHYYGYMVDGKPSRRGIMEYADSSVYDGEWNNGKFDGEGIFSNEQYTYRGSFLNNYPHGTGSLLFKDFSSYVGEWKDGMPNGKGVMNFPNGDSYDGEWLNSEFDGNGTYFYSFGDMYSGEFRNGLQHGEGMYTCKDFSYSGHWDEGWMNDFGIIEYKNGDVYEGNFVENQKYGFGTYSFNTGNVYEGEFVDDRINGLGTFYFSDGSIYEGEFEDGKIYGDGTFYCVINNDTVAITAFWDGEGNIPTEVSMLFSNGDLYEGPLKNGQPTQDGVWSNVKTGKIINALDDANEWYKSHKETIDKVITYTSIALTVVALGTAIVATGGAATPAVIGLVGKAAGIAGATINVVDAGMRIGSASLDGDYSTVGKEVGTNVAYALAPTVVKGAVKGVGLVGKKVLRTNIARKTKTSLSETAQKISQSRTSQMAKKGVKSIGKSVNNSAIKISKTKPFQKIVTVAKDGSGKLTKTLKNTRDKALKKIKNSKANQKLEKKIAKKIADNDAKILSKYASRHKLSKEKQSLLLKEMNENLELANLIRTDPELYIKKWVNMKKEVDYSKVKIINGKKVLYSEYAGKSYNFELPLNKKLNDLYSKNNKEITINGEKTKKYIAIDGDGKTKTLLTETDEILVEELENGALKVLEVRAGKGLKYYSKKYPNGIPYNQEGFPDFVKAGACKKDKDGNLFVVEAPKGFKERAEDIAKATKVAKEKYGDNFNMDGYTWHHLPGPPEQLVLVDYTVHKMAKHSGGISLKNSIQ